jgi:hypothetical protein
VGVALSMVALGFGVWMLFPTASQSPATSVMAIEGGSDRFPSESFKDWVSYADQVSVVSVVSEEALAEEVIEPGDSYIPRAVTLSIEKTLWRREGAPSARDHVRVITFGWAAKDGERRPVTAWDGPRLEVGSRYVMPLVRAPRDGAEWTPLSLGATLPLNGNVISIAGIVGLPSTIAKQMEGKTPTELVEVLAQTRPDPIAAQNFDLPPDERWQAVLRDTQDD